jgi:prepilin-type N-terminal cleavage/methylation domain-containing protein
MMRELRRRLERVRGADDGLTLVEVIIALLVFAVIMTGAIASTATVLRMTSDNRSREEATNLASQYIDVARVDAQSDIEAMADTTYQKTVDGTTYTIARDVSWITTKGADSACTTAAASGNGSLLFRRVNIRVSWTGQSQITQNIAADTILAPSSKINDPTLATILVSVQSINGGGMPNVTATIAPDPSVTGNTAQALTSDAQPEVTNSDGCTIAEKVAPGTYTVTLSPPSGQYRDEKQAANPVKSVTVAAGDSGGVQFDYDPAADLQDQYTAGVAATLPSNLTTSYVSTYGVFQTTATVSDQYLSPYGSGYSVYAGNFAPAGTSGGSCLSVDPTAWPKSADNRTGKAPTVTSAKAGVTSQPTVPMGAATINVNAKSTTIKAVTTTAANGDPGCTAGMSYTYSRTATSGNGTMTIALPYGTWAITQSTNGTTFSSVTFGTLAGAILGTLVTTTGNVATVDPRTAG